MLGVLKLNTITDGLTVKQESVDQVGISLQNIVRKFKRLVPPINVEQDILLIEKASPTHGSS